MKRIQHNNTIYTVEDIARIDIRTSKSWTAFEKAYSEFHQAEGGTGFTSWWRLLSEFISALPSTFEIILTHQNGEILSVGYECGDMSYGLDPFNNDIIAQIVNRHREVEKARDAAYLRLSKWLSDDDDITTFVNW